MEETLEKTIISRKGTRFNVSGERLDAVPYFRVLFDPSTPFERVGEVTLNYRASTIRLFISFLRAQTGKLRSKIFRRGMSDCIMLADELLYCQEFLDFLFPDPMAILDLGPVGSALVNELLCERLANVPQIHVEIISRIISAGCTANLSCLPPLSDDQTAEIDNFIPSSWLRGKYVRMRTLTAERMIQLIDFLDAIGYDLFKPVPEDDLSTMADALIGYLQDARVISRCLDLRDQKGITGWPNVPLTLAGIYRPENLKKILEAEPERMSINAVVDEFKVEGVGRWLTVENVGFVYFLTNFFGWGRPDYGDVFYKMVVALDAGLRLGDSELDDVMFTLDRTIAYVSEDSAFVLSLYENRYPGCFGPDFRSKIDPMLSVGNRGFAEYGNSVSELIFRDRVEIAVRQGAPFMEAFFQNSAFLKDVKFDIWEWADDTGLPRDATLFGICYKFLRILDEAQLEPDCSFIIDSLDEWIVIVLGATGPFDESLITCSPEEAMGLLQAIKNGGEATRSLNESWRAYCRSHE